MFYLYNQKISGNVHELLRLEKVSLAGTRAGLIVQYLKTKSIEDITEPYTWHIPINDLFKRLELKGNVLVIDLRPTSKVYITLFKIKNIWGRSSSGWTPILLELNEILDTDKIKDYDRKHFKINNFNEDYSVFTSLYISGSIKNGEIVGTWNFPRPSSTNSVLLWPETLDFFAKQMGYRKISGKSSNL